MRMRPTLAQTAIGLAMLLGLVVLAVPAGPPVAAVTPDTLSLTVTNHSGRPEEVHLYVLGIKDGEWGYADAAGSFAPWTAGATPPVPAPDVSIDGPEDDSSTSLAVPRGMSGRVYMSFGDRLDFGLTEDGMVQPAPWTDGDSSQDVLFDWSEFTFNDAGVWLNSTQVDMFAVPHTVSVTDASGATSTAGEMAAGGREAVIEGMRHDPAFSELVRERADGTVLRVLAPGKGRAGGRLETYLDPAIDRAWDAYGDTDLTVRPFEDPDLSFTGRTSGDRMIFRDSQGTEVATFTKPRTSDVWGCAGALSAPNDLIEGPIARTLCAALQRGTLGTAPLEPSLDAASFYRHDPANLYAKLIHEQMVDGRAYAFAFDDVAHQESLVHSENPTSIGITIEELTS